jgi:hypothetical protein
MSFSISTGGTIPEVRRTLAEQNYYHDQYGRDRRIATAAILSHIEAHEAAGATHVRVTGSGHDGQLNLTVTRDVKAEAEHKYQIAQKKQQAWLSEGIESGYLSPVEQTDGREADGAAQAVDQDSAKANEYDKAQVKRVS